MSSARAAALFVVAFAGSASAQAIDLTGTYRFDKSASEVTPGVGLSGLGAGGTPNTLYIEQATNGTITVGSDLNEGQSRLYRANGESAIPAGKGDPVAVKSRFDGRALIVEGPALKETLTLSADAKKLTVSVTVGEATSTLVYTRMQSVDDCKSWPTPCR